MAVLWQVTLKVSWYSHLFLCHCWSHPRLTRLLSRLWVQPIHIEDSRALTSDSNNSTWRSTGRAVASPCSWLDLSRKKQQQNIPL